MTQWPLELRHREIDGQKFPTVEYADSPTPICVAVSGEIFPWYWGNRKKEAKPAKDKKRMEFQKWKSDIARAVGEKRGDQLWKGNDGYIISIGLVFGVDGPHDADVDNHIKPILDATATALFAPSWEGFLKPILDAIQNYSETNVWERPKDRRWGEDDHKFKTVFAHRLPNSGRTLFDSEPGWSKEGITICISSPPP